ncbi:FAD-dependent oxidoreductase [Paenibacillus antri]|uniref:FAD-dependent oxidoreductase n=1 Tax=Paenibacillus antri TaxID=2582848 RepID=A0A5R9GEM4_9BACL|nr:FAD-dependent oxidoreductase [Paenibacillus antri]TLS51808.1 FAD-dependent oxidoreductase [Paenibacillus antri]
MERVEMYDVVVYGGNAAGIVAGIQVARMGMKAIVLEPSSRIGGLTTGGLGATDAGDPAGIGGMAREFYERLAADCGREGPMWRFEPSAALRVLTRWAEEAGLDVRRNARLDRNGGVATEQGRVTSMTLESGEVVRGRVFIDATYEGDLMAGAGVSYTVGRESNDRYGESNNGIRKPVRLHPAVDPYRVPGDKSSGLLARVNPDPGGAVGEGDRKVQAYNYRMCLTDDPDNRVPVEKPDGYREEDYEILFRLLEAGYDAPIFKLTMMPGRKTDSNNTGVFSTDYIGMNYDYAEADDETRRRIEREHETFQKGLVWTVQHHPRVPERIRESYRPWGLPKDEFTESGHWPSQLYVREARRMLGEVVVTEHTARREALADDPVGLGSYAMDSHYIQYCLDEEGFLCTEGGMMGRVAAPYPISYRAIVPKRSECENLLVPVCLSATHAAYGSIRMEPAFMVLGQSAATAAVLTARRGGAVQELPYAELRAALERGGQVLDLGDDYVTPPGTTGNPL